MPPSEPQAHPFTPAPLTRADAGALRATLAAARDRVYAAGHAVGDTGKVFPLWPVGMDRPAADALRDLVVRERAARTLEVGLGLGLSALAIVEGLAAVAEAAGQGAGPAHAQHVIVEPSPEWCDLAGLRTLEHAGGLRLARLVREPSHLGLPGLLREGAAPFDLAMIDGAHWYDHVALDVFYALRLVRPGGLIVLDDHWMPAVQIVLAHAVTNYGAALELFDPQGPARRLVAFRNPGPCAGRAWDHFAPFSRDDLPDYPWRRGQARGAEVVR